MTKCREVHISQVKESDKKEKNLMKEKAVIYKYRRNFWEWPGWQYDNRSK